MSTPHAPLVLPDFDDPAQFERMVRLARESEDQAFVACGDPQPTKKPGEAEIQAAQLEQARQQGRSQGRAEAEAAAKATLNQATEALRTVARALDEALQQNQAEQPQQVLELAFAVAGHLLHREVQADPMWVRENVARALAAAVEADEYQVHLHPQDLALLLEHAPHLAAELGPGRHIALVEDEAIERGGALIDSPNGRVDATIRSQLATLFAQVAPPQSA